MMKRLVSIVVLIFMEGICAQGSTGIMCLTQDFDQLKTGLSQSESFVQYLDLAGYNSEYLSITGTCDTAFLAYGSGVFAIPLAEISKDDNCTLSLDWSVPVDDTIIDMCGANAIGYQVFGRSPMKKSALHVSYIAGGIQIFYVLPKPARFAQMRIMTIDGALVWVAEIENSSGMILWDRKSGNARCIGNAPYVCSVVADGKLIASARFMLLENYEVTN